MDNIKTILIANRGEIAVRHSWAWRAKATNLLTYQLGTDYQNSKRIGHQDSLCIHKSRRRLIARFHGRCGEVAPRT